MTDSIGAEGVIMNVRKQRLFPGVYFAVALVVVVVYVGLAILQNGDFGFPLDDAWIHQVYARNLGTRLEFSFFAGQPSAGSTSPLWALLLGLGYALRIDYRVWTLLLGVVFLGATGWMGQKFARNLMGDGRFAGWAVPLCLILEWHMVWAAASGMEIVLFVFLALALMVLTPLMCRAAGLPSGIRVSSHHPTPERKEEEGERVETRYVLRGLVGGLLVLTRPEGIILVGLVGVCLVYREVRRGWTGRTLVSLGGYAAAVLVLLAPYFWFNWQASGTILPNTFYAKGAEYAELTTQSNFFARWLMMYRQPLIGAQVLLIPGLVYGIYVFVKRRDWVRVLPALWILVLPALYAWRLPVEYQFGRYMMPIIPFVMVYGVVGTVFLFERIPMRLLRRAWGLTIAVLLAAFVFLGAGFYGQSVAIVNCEMVAVGKWTRVNLPQGDLIAAHDIGAQEYFDERPLLDMAGLVSPQVIPFIRDEGKLKEWVIGEGARYVIFFPTWYPKLAADGALKEIYSTGCATTREMGEENLGVYIVE